MTQEAREPQLSRKWTKKARVKIETADKVAFNGLLLDHYNKVQDNNE